MKQWIQSPVMAAAMFAAVTACAAEADIQVGDTEEKVREMLGEPAGYIRIDGVQMLYFDRGDVKLEDGVVTETQLITQSQLEARRRSEELERLRLRRLETERREQLQLEGLAIRERMLKSGTLDGKSPEEQLDAWNGFRDRYPDVPVGGEVAAALERIELQLERNRLEAEQRQRDLEMKLRMQELENRVANAEDRARDAEDRARDAEHESRRSRTSYVYPATVTRYPVSYTYRPHPSHPSTAPVQKACTTTKTRFGTQGINRTVTKTHCTPTYRTKPMFTSTPSTRSVHHVSPVSHGFSTRRYTIGHAHTSVHFRF